MKACCEHWHCMLNNNVTVKLAEKSVTFEKIRLARYEAALLQFAYCPQAADGHSELVRWQKFLEVQSPGNFFEDLMSLFCNRFGRERRSRSTKAL